MIADVDKVNCGFIKRHRTRDKGRAWQIACLGFMRAKRKTLHAWQGVSRIVINCMSLNAGGPLYSNFRNHCQCRDSEISTTSHLQAEPKILVGGCLTKELPRLRSPVARNELFLQVEKRVKVDQPTKTSHCSVFMACFGYPCDHLAEGSPTKSNVSPLYRASVLKRGATGADGSQKLIAMQDATGAIVISYQMYMVENRAIPVVGIINAPRYGTLKDAKKLSVALVPIH